MRTFEPMTAVCVRDIWSHILERTDGEWVNKKSDAFQKAIGAFLEATGIQEKKAYDEQYMTTFKVPGAKKTIYATPFDIGVPNEVYDLEAQANGAPHEGQHGLDTKRIGVWKFDTDYIFHTSRRAHTEMRANRSMAEFMRARAGIILDPQALADALRFYGCAHEIPFSAAEHRSVLVTVNAGGIIDGECGQLAIDFLIDKYPQMVTLNPYTDY